MPQSSWKTAVDGNWDDGTKWDTGVAPNSASADAALTVGANNGSIPYVVTVLPTDHITVNSLLIDNESAKLFDEGTLSVGSLALNNGLVELGDGTLSAGSASIAGELFGSGALNSTGTVTVT